MEQQNFEQKEKYWPQIELVKDKKADFEVFMAFWRSNQSVHPDLDYTLKIDDEEKVKEEVKIFLDTYYDKNETGINKEYERAKKEWQEVEEQFFNKVEELFKGYDWPEGPDSFNGKYRGVASIWKIFPRFIKDKWFTFPVNPEMKYNPKFVIAHEMLHFIEYEYMEKEYGLKPSNSGDEDNTFWQFTENLNVLIQNEDYWKDFTKGHKPEPKQEYNLELFERMKKAWDEQKDIDYLISKTFSVDKKS